MRNSRVLTGAAMTIAALGLASAPAFAGDYGKLDVSPSPAKAGAEVTVYSTACGANGSAQGDASAVGGPASFELRAGAKDTVAGTFRVPEHAKPGTYGVGIRCHTGKEATGDVVVTDKGDKGEKGEKSPAPEKKAPGKAAPASSAPAPMHPGAGQQPPKGAVKTGVGSTSDNSGLTELMAGAALLATAAVGGTWFLTRRGRGNRI
ncbi:hypothetical protein ACFP1Z_16250 [Streptomyces gamaensis]|uniref:Sortase n=1 Tax=Streptomyces gamaensis TaxID=1763542 RepID=A0ABW0Z5N7_9ACTN